MTGDILVITNNHNSSLTYTPTLMAYGHRIDEAQTFAGARIRLRAGILPSLIIIDTKFEQENCYDFIYALRTSSQWAHIQIIVIGTEFDAVDALSMNIIRFARPVHIENLLATVQKAEIA